MNQQKILSDKVTSLSESATLKMSALANELKRDGRTIYNLSLGEPDFDTPQHIKYAVCKALDAGYTKYSPVPGMIQLREAIKMKLLRDNKLDYDINQIVVSTGAKQSISNIVDATVNPGDEVILFSPYWVSYYDIVTLAGGVPVCLKTDINSDFKVTPSQVDDAINEKTKLIIFSSPCNPSGSVYTQSELEAIAEVVGGKDVLIISDEIYEYINYREEHFSIGRIPAVANQTVTVNGFSKGFAMTGWRLGYMAGPQFLATACAKIQGQCTSGANTFAQIAAISAYTESMEPTLKMKERFYERKQLVQRLLKEIPGIKVNDPKGAFYLFPDISELIGKKTADGKVISDSETMTEYLLQEAGVATVAGSAFGLENHIRISFATSEEELTKALNKMKEAVEKLS